ncbi:MAG TPA: DUF6271 family protein [Acidimicrobiales bacterium]|nr:DUF6271 family protein [Acidimicrobiales bacterium]
MKWSNLVYLPTHRMASDAIRCALAETQWLANQGHSAPVFCLIENGLRSEQSREHREVLIKEGRAAGISWLHLTEDRAGALVDLTLDELELSPAERSRLRALLLPQGTSYGRGPNLAAILGCALGCSVLHRRDSDIYLDDARAGELPVEFEASFIGQSLDAVSGRIERVDEFTPAPSALVQMVGTSSFGAPTFDRRDLMAAGKRYLVEFQQLGRPGSEEPEVAEEAFDYFIREPSTRYDNDRLEVDIDNRIEMECVAVSTVFKVLPEMPTGIIGCDYMQKDLLWWSGEGLIFHTRKVRHQYAPDREARADLAAYLDYAMRDVEYIQMGRVWQRHNMQMQRFRSRHRGLVQFDPESYVSSFRQAVEQVGSELEEVRGGAQQVYESAAAASSGDLAGRLKAVADVIADRGPAMDQRVREAVEDYCVLVLAWRELCEFAAHVEVPSEWIST